jgi:hypothetical protein
MVIGHNWVRDHLAHLAMISDEGTSLEATCSEAFDITSQRQRPGDILTSAASLGGGVGKAAIDVGVVCPHSREAIVSPAKDPLSLYEHRKRMKSEELCKEAGWMFRPFVISCYGRPSDGAVEVVHRLAKSAAKRYGVDSVTKIEQNWWKQCSTLLAARAAEMVRRCLPHIVPPWEDDEAESGHDDAGRMEEVDVAGVIGREEGSCE